MPPRCRRPRHPPGPRRATDKPPPRFCATASLLPRLCPAESLPRRRRASRFTARSRSWRGVREQCRRAEEATHLSKSPPATPRRATTRLLRPRRSAPSPLVAVAPRRASLVVAAPRLPPRFADVAPRPSPCPTGRCARPGAPASPRCRPGHPPAPGNRRGDSPGSNDKHHHAPRHRGVAPGVPRRRGPARAPIGVPRPRGMGACTDGARGRFSRRDRLLAAARGGTSIVTRSGGGGGRRAAAREARPSRQLSTLGVFR